MTPTPILPRQKHVQILLVEDNPGDIILITEAFKEANVQGTFSIAKDGVEALEYLYTSQKVGSLNVRPELIILDLNMPRKDGHEVLLEIKKSKDLRSIPVIVMTTSKDSADILRAYDAQANCYITKPVDFNQLTRVAKSIEEFWLTLVQLPGKA